MEFSFSNLPRHCVVQLKSAALYLLCGMALGLYMAVSGDHALRPVHTHVNLLGWGALGGTGLVYGLVPELAQRRLADVHVWLHNAGLPAMMVGLALYVSGYPQFEPLLGAGSVLTAGGLGAFAVNVWFGLSVRETGRNPVRQKV